MKPRALILHANGTNRDHDAAFALDLAGAAPEIVHLNQLRSGERRWQEYQMLVLPGGFSYADALGAGKLLALELRSYFADEAREFIAAGKPVLGICNGFQTLVKSGILPGAGEETRATLTFNASGHFECRWTRLAPQSQLCVWTRGLDEAIECPVAHGEGNFVLSDPSALPQSQIALRYCLPDGAPANGSYPENPNGSMGDIAGVCNSDGTVLGLMPHPENHVLAHQHPRWTRGAQGRPGLPLFVQGVRYAEGL